MTLLSVSELRTTYRSGSVPVHAVDGVSLDIAPGETVGLVGESGCGKSTLGKTILRLVEPSAGRITFDGTDLTTLPEQELRAYRRRLQMVFQDPFASLNPRQTIGDILGAPLDVHRVGSRSERRQRVGEILSQVGLPEDAVSRYPHEFSGGQRQRIGIARALILGPDLIICDEPVSALDLSVQAQVLNLLADIKRRLNLSLLFISHDLSVVRYLSDRILVMYLGRIVESGSHEQIWNNPLHPYTRALIDAVPDPARRRYAAPLPGDLPDPRSAGRGCRFQPRCPLATELCAQQDPELRNSLSGQSVACHHADLLAS
ncbi:ATP-binding cassette domain-containing protein [Bradyrhizobium sp. 61]|uniref:ABC transporter ATP-binding protein n=1 Tax=unclassified Bradyrhizobium TaxID=2631580 RepID=UPI001FFB1248|nr:MULTISPECIES: oligopeptide/dipeptide ABC transporter ATP-binding protein [unclassified Bradyrhizobium]MCK1274639.1 ATP-binding cassette domain-containing protein [Bradyrhizobium sp. 61]MCK1441633.1 ATP-binding cassette domain-containing protein [Bradyrhizobium sp. 48]MCK1465175.1 ATP-binding cassette domain-containing protein [Bradyrhizobium sp. 2]